MTEPIPQPDPVQGQSEPLTVSPLSRDPLTAPRPLPPASRARFAVAVAATKGNASGWRLGND